MLAALRHIRKLTPNQSSRFRQFSQHPDVVFLPDFFNPHEQRVLLAASLRKLDAVESRLMKRRRKDFLDKLPQISDTLHGFLPDDLYRFEPGHFDGVIKNYREMLVSSWDDVASTELYAILHRLRDVYPSSKDATQTHILHLASNGDIFPHVDNVEASGSWILVNELCHEMLLSPGSVYIQKDWVRYNYKHSIVREGPGVTPGQRLSLMIRDRPLPSTQTPPVPTSTLN